MPSAEQQQTLRHGIEQLATFAQSRVTRGDDLLDRTLVRCLRMIADRRDDLDFKAESAETARTNVTRRIEQRLDAIEETLAELEPTP